jgi:hypothetical protein
MLAKMLASLDFADLIMDFFAIAPCGGYAFKCFWISSNSAFCFSKDDSFLLSLLISFLKFNNLF